MQLEVSEHQGTFSNSSVISEILDKLLYDINSLGSHNSDSIYTMNIKQKYFINNVLL